MTQPQDLAEVLRASLLMVQRKKALKSALDAIDEVAGQPDMALLRAKARGLMIGYDTRWREQDYDAQAVEDTVTAELFNPDTLARSRTFTLAGKIDVHVTRNGRSGIIDHKTTSEDIADPNSDYWRQLIVESQLSHYMLLEWLNGRKPEFAVWDVIRKPDIRPRELKKIEREFLAYRREYCGEAVTEEQADAALKWGKETPDLYEIRLAKDCTQERPERYFQRRSIQRLDNELIEYARELWEHSQDIIVARRENRHPRNSGACIGHWTCKFLGVCSGHDEIESANWQKKEWMHPELPIIAGRDGREILTNSRIRTWQTCRRRHKFQYELGIERAEAEDQESLIFGDLMHHALAAWWRCFIPKGEDHGNASVAANAVAIT